MAVYKVPQDVEADDKLLGPLSFRQFIYAVVAVIACAVAFFLSQLFVALVIIPLPIIALFTILALPLRKDQPMEMYLIAIIRFMLKPRFRLWQPEGNIALVEIVAPRAVEEQRTNGLSQDEARNRLDYLAQLMDSRGWSARNTTYPGLSTPVAMPIADSDISNDIMDKDANISRNFDTLLAKKDTQRQLEARQRVEQMQSEARQVTAVTTPDFQRASPAVAPRVSLDDLITQQKQTPLATTPQLAPSIAVVNEDQTTFDYNPYPQSMHQQVIKPFDPSAVSATPQAASYQESPQAPSPFEIEEPKPMTTTVSPDIMRLATESKNLSISTLANEAHRLQQKQDENEVVVSLH